MNDSSFWASAWSLVTQLQAGPTGDPKDVVLIRRLTDDLTLQQYAFMVRRFAEPDWLLPFRREGLFDEPPPVEHVDGGVRAREWPALTYLRGVVHSEPRVCSDILDRLRSDNWWVVSDAISVAADLPGEVARPALLSLLREWERSAMQWTQPETLIQSMKTIAANDENGSGLTEALSRVLGRFTDDRANRYDLGELLPQLRSEVGDRAITPLADAVESVLLFRSTVTEWHPFAYSLDDLRVDADGVELLVHEWLMSVTSEAKALGGFAPLRRCVRLLGAGPALLRQMGLRALSISLSAEPIEPRSVQLLRRIGSREDLTVNYEELPELLRLFSAHFTVLPPDQQAELVQRLADQAVADERLGRIFARDWLGALRSHLGARERKLLVDLEPDFGPPRESFARPLVEAVWVGPRSPLTLDELQDMPVADLLGHVGHVPVQPDDDWPPRGATQEGFARMLQPLVVSRIGELHAHLAELAETAQSSVVLFYLCWGVRDAFAEEDARTPENLQSVQQFISSTTERAQGVGLPNQGVEEGYSVARALADLIESLGGWLVDTPDETALIATLEWLLRSDDPPSNEPERSGMDPPSRAINSVRGEAVLAALRMLSVYWGDGGRERSGLTDRLEQLLAANVSVEQAPAVLSSYARYLAAIVTNWRPFFEDHQDDLLPTDEASVDRWGAVFGTYVTFYGPHRSTAAILRPHFELAVTRLAEFGDSYFGKQAERLLMHLVALSLPREDDSATWVDLLHDGLDAAQPEVAARAIHDLAFAIKHDGLEIPEHWTLAFVARRALALTARRSTGSAAPGRGRDEAGALIELVFANGVLPSDCIGHVRHLAELGARLPFDDTVEYLTNHDPAWSQSGAVILRLAASQEGAAGYLRHLEDSKKLIRSYAEEHFEVAWDTVEALGARGVFAFEDVARELFDRRETKSD